jgi:cell shape-determining protein MreC
MIGSLSSGGVETVMRVREYFANSSASLPLYIRSRGELDDEIQRLKQEVAAQSGDQTTIARLIGENEELRGLLGDSKDERILAGVIARPPHTPYDTLIIDRGSNHNIVEGAVVYHTNEHAIGVVSRVYEKIALVTLFSSDGVETSVYVYGPDVFAYAYGEGGGVIRISLPQGIEVKEGNAVVLPSLHMGDLGVVERVVSLSTQPEQNAYLTFPISIQSLRTVTVGREAVVTPSLTDLEDGVERLRERFRIDIPEALRLGTGTTPNGATNTSPAP